MTAAGVTPDYTIPAGFIAVNGGTIRINNGSIDTVAYTALPTGTQSKDRNGNVATATPTNFAGVTGSIPAGDTTAPSVPAGVTAIAVSSSAINISWNEATDNILVTQYKLYRNGVMIYAPTLTEDSLICTSVPPACIPRSSTYTIPDGVSPYLLGSLAASTIYSYTVAACDAAGNCSAQSAQASATTQAPPDTTPPTVPGNFTATAVSSSQINLAWTASTDAVGVTSYHVFRGGVQIATLNSATLSFNNTGLVASTLYNYGVRGCDAAGNCSTQATASATTLMPGVVFGPGARTQFEGFRDGPTADTFVNFSTLPITLSAGTGLTTELSSFGVTFSSNVYVDGTPMSTQRVFISSAPGRVGSIVGTYCSTCADDGRVGYQVVFTAPQRRAGLLRIWNAETLTQFYNQSNQLLGQYVGTGFVGFIAVGSNPATDWVSRIQIDTVASPASRQVGYSDDLFFGSAAIGSTFTPALDLGFNLISNSLDIAINVPATFGNADAPVAGVTGNVVTIWKWNAVDGRWAFYAPQLSAAGIAAFAASKGYDVLTTINPGEGYWVNALNPVTLPAQTGAPFNWTPATFANLPTGFNLIAHTDERTPSEFNIDVSPTPPAQGTVPTGNFLTLWVWDAVAAKWYFYSPLLESSGGLQAVKDYADSHFYLHFQDFNKKVGLGVGFWVNRP